ncbi:hypothetical protein BDY19DRAFT_573593 [Irpex rosettiformis]|uniref:Uncharacterized protein n=1 Tax=Irpex rosettiformis TaxID=378272 RepID=A0ACB8UCQ4_9APHY|nr:hypothetical protein BDY19DRAFT_573593 [Irpex rosettiformis]
MSLVRLNVPHSVTISRVLLRRRESRRQIMSSYLVSNFVDRLVGLTNVSLQASSTATSARISFARSRMNEAAVFCQTICAETVGGSLTLANTFNVARSVTTGWDMATRCYSTQSKRLMTSADHIFHGYCRLMLPLPGPRASLEMRKLHSHSRRTARGCPLLWRRQCQADRPESIPVRFVLM